MAMLASFAKQFCCACNQFSVAKKEMAD